jgi:endonuclease/exonuclease/phosphatase family metal-dependent hydrolase
MIRLRLLACNLDGNRAPWRPRKAALRQLLAATSADFVVLEQVLRPAGGGASQADELAEGLGYRVAYGVATQIERPLPCAVGHAVLSRFPLREQSSEPLPGPSDGAAGMLYLVYSVRVGLLPLLVAQLASGPPALQKRQLAHLGRYLAAKQAALPTLVPAHVGILPPLLCGDLGTELGDSECGQLRDLTPIGAKAVLGPGDNQLLVGQEAVGEPPLRVTAQKWTRVAAADCSALVVELDYAPAAR